jgi:diphosphomevalonate decarboxylase
MSAARALRGVAPSLPLVVWDGGEGGDAAVAGPHPGWAAARARVNIALIKYWGKAPAPTPDDINLPAVPSLSLTLDGLYSTTVARFAPELGADRVILDGVELVGTERQRAVKLLDAARRWYDIASPFEVLSENNVPTAAGLASSASGMAAMAAAVGRLIGLDPQRPEEAAQLSELARIGSGSASRSIFGGWVAWDGRFARPLCSASEGPAVAVVIAVVTRDRKPIPSRDGMTATQRTSPFFAGWVEQSHATFHEAVDALARQDLPALLTAMELSTWRMHASGMGANPPVFYWLPASLAVLHEVDKLKSEGLLCGATLDAGPNVKVFCQRRDADAIALRLTTVPGVAHTITAAPGDGVVSAVPFASSLASSGLQRTPFADDAAPGPSVPENPMFNERVALRERSTALVASRSVGPSSGRPA